MMKKTLAMKFLDGQKVPYVALEYGADLRDAEKVAQALNMAPEQVFKTLVVSRSQPGKNILAMVPANRQLNLKKLAKAAGEKKLKMAAHQDAERVTGLKVGGISALALVNRGFDVFLDESAVSFSQIVVSAGERGQQIRLDVPDLIKITNAHRADISEMVY